MLNEFASELHAKLFPLDQPAEESSKNAHAHSRWNNEAHDGSSEFQEIAIENLADLDEKVMEKCIEEDELSDEFLVEKL